MAHEVLQGNFQRLPATITGIVENDIGAFQRRLIAPTKGRARFETTFGKARPDLATFLRERPDLLAKYGQDAALKEIEWIPSLNEVKREARDKTTLLLASLGAPVADLVRAELVDIVGCGPDEGVTPCYWLRPLWFAFLELRNLESRSVTLQSLTHVFRDQPGYRRLDSYEPGAEDEFALPATPLGPQEALWIPVGCVLAPMSMVEDEMGHELGSGADDAEIYEGEEREFISDAMDDEVAASGRYQVIHELRFDVSRGDFHIAGPSIAPRTVNVRDGIGSTPQEIHAFDLRSCFLVDRHWYGSSCPHAFLLPGAGLARYLGEVLIGPPNTASSSSLTIGDAGALVIAELEKERTTIDSVLVNGEVVAANVTLDEGQQLQIPVPAGARVAIHGSYAPYGPTTEGVPLIAWRRRLVSRFLRRISGASELPLLVSMRH